jgi:hypothetical protein
MTRKRLLPSDYPVLIAACQAASPNSDHGDGWFSVREVQHTIPRTSDTVHLDNIGCEHLDEMTDTGVLEWHSGTPMEKGTYAHLYRLVSPVVPVSVLYEAHVKRRNDAHLDPEVRAKMIEYIGDRSEENLAAWHVAIDKYEAQTGKVFESLGWNTVDARNALANHEVALIGDANPVLPERIPMESSNF